MYKKLISVVMIIFSVINILPLKGIAIGNPWDPYLEYIPTSTPIEKRDLRATWISTVYNLDWPSAATSRISDDSLRIEKSKEELIKVLDRAVEMNMNAVMFQVRTGADALYKSDLVPWSRYLTGTYGKDPGFDPLAFAIEEAHKRNIELHAWFNPYRVSMDMSDATKQSLNIPKSVYKEHPDWIKTANNRFVVDPGIPDARKWVEDCVMEVVNKYDIDGVHFDDYFYYEAYVNEMDDSQTYNKYNNGQFTNKDDWRRNNTYLLIKELSEKMEASKKWVKFGISPAGVWGNKSDGHPDGSNTTAGIPNYDCAFADTKKWVEDEIIDYICPQVYWSFGTKSAPYGEVASWWSNVVRGRNVHLYIGQALYKVNESSDIYFTEGNGVPEMSRQIKFNISKPEIKGSVLFRHANLNSSNKVDVVNNIQYDLWSTKALVPEMPWKGGLKPNIPSNGEVDNINTNGIKINWTDYDTNTAYFAIYRFNEGESIDTKSSSSAKNLITTVRKSTNGSQSFTDKNIDTNAKVEYVVTALDRLHNESDGLKITRGPKTISKYFKDIDEGLTWAVQDIDSLYEQGVIKGEGNGIFNPNNSVKRGDFTLMIVNAFGFKAEIKDNFTDVSKDSYYYNSIAVAKSIGLTQGVGNNLFNPESNIKREEMMEIIFRTMKLAGIKIDVADISELNKFKDVSQVSEYARTAIASLTKAGIVNGMGENLEPQSTATRAEASVLINNILKRKI